MSRGQTVLGVWQGEARLRAERLGWPVVRFSFVRQSGAGVRMVQGKSSCTGKAVCVGLARVLQTFQNDCWQVEGWRLLLGKPGNY